MRTRILRLLMRSAECRDGLPVSSMSRRGRKAIRCLFANSVLGAVGRGSDYFSSSEILQKNTNIFLHGYYSSNTLYVKKRFSLVTRFKTKHRIFFFFLILFRVSLLPSGKTIWLLDIITRVTWWSPLPQ